MAAGATAFLLHTRNLALVRAHAESHRAGGGNTSPFAFSRIDFARAWNSRSCATSPESAETRVGSGDVAAVVELRGASKVFRLRHNAAKNLKVRLIRLYNLRHQERVEEFWAFRDIDPTVRTGECFGLIGPNGSGKSTPLHVMAGILRPTTGHVVVSGRVAPMIELGAGFHADLIGEENIYLNTSLFWFSRREAEAIYRDVVAFSELDHFIDQPVKNYSVGMYMRLGFAPGARHSLRGVRSGRGTRHPDRNAH
jgi:hypothetical protein